MSGPGHLPSSDRIDLVEFTVGDDRFAIPLAAVREIVPLGGTPEPTIEYRGSTLAVWRGEELLGLRAGDREALRRGIVVRGEPDDFVVAVERVLAVGAVPEDEIQAPPEFLEGGRTADVVRGVVTRGDATIIVLEPGRLAAGTGELRRTSVVERETDGGV
jgi:chemotaxis signal transduction protein